MVWWPFIVLGILAFLLFYPITIRADIGYAEEDYYGIATLHPFFCLKWPKITIWDDKKPKKENAAKAEAKKKKAEEKAKKKAEKKAKKAGGDVEVKQKRKMPPEEIILMAIDILKSGKKGIKRLRVRLSLNYAMADPAAMGYLTGAIYGVLPLIMGDNTKCRWRVGIYPNFQAFETTAHCKAKVTLCLFDIFYAFGGILMKIIKMLIQKLRRK